MTNIDNQGKQPILRKNKAGVLEQLETFISDGGTLCIAEIEGWAGYDSACAEVATWIEASMVYLNSVFDNSNFADRLAQIFSSANDNQDDMLTECVFALRVKINRALNILKTARGVAQVLEHEYSYSPTTDEILTAIESDQDEPEPNVQSNAGLTLYDFIERHPVALKLIIGAIVALPVLFTIILLLAVFGLLAVDIWGIHLSKPTNPTP